MSAIVLPVLFRGTSTSAKSQGKSGYEQPATERINEFHRETTISGTRSENLPERKRVANRRTNREMPQLMANALSLVMQGGFPDNPCRQP